MNFIDGFLSQKNIDSELNFEKYITKETLNDKKQHSIKDTCYFKGTDDIFKRHYKEDKMLSICLQNVSFEKNLIFDNVKILSLTIANNVDFKQLTIFNCNKLFLQFNGEVKIKDKISISSCNFQKIFIDNNINGNIEFQRCNFNDFNLYNSGKTIYFMAKFTFDFCEIKKIANFMNFHFKDKISFKMSKFKDKVYFNNSYFSDYTDFHECEFEKTACFYGVTFDKVPNFSACYFREQKAVNLTNIDIDKLDFKSIKKCINDNHIDKIYNNDKKEMEKIKQRDKLKYTTNLKDSFRTIKDVLITQNNILEAQKWHKLELYAKEEEWHMKLNFEERKINTNVFNNILIWFNCVLLNLYRNTSDHHTNFLRILNFTIGMICVYYFFIIGLLTLSKYTPNKFYLSATYIFILMFISVFSFMYKNKNNIFAKSLFFLAALMYICLIDIIISHKIVVFVYLICYIFLIYIFYFILNFNYFILNFLIKIFLYCTFIHILVLNPNFINPFISVFSSDKFYKSQFEKNIQDLNSTSIINLAKISYKDFNLFQNYQNITFMELDSAKKLLIENKDNIANLKNYNLSVVEKFFGDKYAKISNAINEDKIISNTIKYTNILYNIILLLCIFSLQKTARKNSIIPT
ncbi:hypothetical protein CINS5915_02870 [Campylobacter insulaenigrae]|uniref:hypothetical protein n=1 Tax=Campylobacter insulaenigrae TaxID=260714 RepID=UPI0021525756|nr:hypothetical protein [Campylobacter insulaenigrae]MCR6572519.1 hypothetical protein [Campylobacter insulaenigrae]MCR6573488.1 hypothetical protein [Campylobacter insulaenigrae]MCR6575310.1 hypothetical protein [Campylobacter insulaenigrae]MCR6579993.1 hypothetical protein [Campylobacter insulaenigrae]MCR6581395.1 hypothetical protein [Campylobacter insulaenigrae]